jgi:hypothetical protein
MRYPALMEELVEETYHYKSMVYCGNELTLFHLMT